MNTVCERLIADLRRRLDTALPLRDTFDVPGMLYHYTNECGLKGIVESGTLFAGHYERVNDPTELVGGEEVARWEILKFKDSPLCSSPLKILLLESIGIWFNRQPLSAVADFFITSFCPKNHLTLWRHYGGQYDDCTGFAVGFEIVPDGDGRIGGSPNLGLWPCYYVARNKPETTGFAESIRSALNTVACAYERVVTPELGALDPAEEKRVRGEVAVYAMRAITFACSKYKNADFEDEREWRLVFIRSREAPDPDANVLTNETPVREVIRFSSNSSIRLREILVGPGANRNGRARLARELLDSMGYLGVTVNDSGISYVARK